MAINFPNSPAVNDVFASGITSWRWDGAKWNSNTVARVAISDTPPTGAIVGDEWWNSSDGQLYIYYNDGSSTQWVIANNPAGFLPVGVTADILMFSGTSWVNQRPRYNVGFSFIGGLLSANQLLGLHKFSKAITFGANFGPYLGHASEAGGTANATASTVINVDRALTATPNTFTNVGTITIAPGTVTPTFATTGSSSISFAIGDIMRLVGPGTADTTFANFYATLIGYET
jgi:hypothetical protein